MIARRKPHQEYAGLWLLLGGFGHAPKQWTALQDPEKGITKTNGNLRDEVAERIRILAMVCDLYQDIMRIRLRVNPDDRAQIFLPSAQPPFVVRLLRLFKGAKIVTKSGQEFSFAGDFGPKRTPIDFTPILEI